MNHSVIKFKIYSVEMQDLNTNTNLSGLLVLVFDSGSDSAEDMTKNLCEYLHVLKTFINLVHTSIYLSSCFDRYLIIGNLIIIHTQQAFISSTVNK